jgi:hypothetical protein
LSRPNSLGQAYPIRSNFNSRGVNAREMYSLFGYSSAQSRS